MIKMKSPRRSSDVLFSKEASKKFLNTGSYVKYVNQSPDTLYELPAKEPIDMSRTQD